MPAVSSLYIYAEPRCRAIDFEEIADYARSLMSECRVSLRGPLLEDSIAGGSQCARVSAEILAERLARAKVRCMDAPFAETGQVLPGEAAYELRRLTNRGSTVFGILYDAHELSWLMQEMLPAGESGEEHLHVVFSNQLIGTWDEGDLRYHARSVLLGAPAIISTSGLVEAPAKARGYYLARRSGGGGGAGGGGAGRGGGGGLC